VRDERPKLGKWMTVTGPNAYCNVCSWSYESSQSDPKDARRMMSAARFHCRDTGHDIQIQRGQSAVMR
jgi:hypothetical protein